MVLAHSRGVFECLILSSVFFFFLIMFGFGHIPMPSNLGFSSCFYWVLYGSRVSFKWVLMIILSLLFKLG